MSQLDFPSGSGAAVLGYEPMATHRYVNAFDPPGARLLTDSDRLLPEVKTELDRLGVKSILVVGDLTITTALVDELKRLGYDVTTGWTF